jgi:hypothetical protein
MKNHDVYVPVNRNLHVGNGIILHRIPTRVSKTSSKWA